MTDSSPTCTRIAPSPTGDPHVGTAYQALFSKVVAEAAGGRFILRIEDTDRERSSQESEDMIFEALRWLGLDWSEGPDVGGPAGPYRQSERVQLHQKHVGLLLEKGAAYRCFCTPERLAALKVEQKAAKTDYGYDGKCASLAPDEAAERAQEESFVVRLKVPATGDTIVHDELRGDVVFANAGIDDQVLLKSDGFPTYHLANVVDDHSMGVTHVIRGEEWLSSLPKHLLLYQAFGWQTPLFIHTPLLRNPDGSKFSKRKNPVSLDWYRQEGYLPEALVNFLASLGWSHPEEKDLFDQDEFREVFDWRRMSLSGPIFDMDKLTHLNGLWIRSLSDEALLDRILDGGHAEGVDAPRDFLLGVTALVKERLTRLGEFKEMTEFFFEAPSLADPGTLVGKKATPEAVKKALTELREAFHEISPESFTLEAIEETLRAVATASELKPKFVFMGVRVALTGRAVSTPLFETAELLGRDRVLARLDAAACLL